MLTIITELTQFAPTQSNILNFNSYTLVGNTYMAANSSGIYSIGVDADADGSDIDAYFKLIRTDFGIPNDKRLRAMYLGYETDGSLLVTITPDEDSARAKSFTLAGRIATQKQHGGRIPLRRDLRGRYFDFKFANVDGADFSIDSIKLIVTVLGYGPRS